MYQRVTLAAGVAVEFQESADFLRVLECSQPYLQIVFYRGGQEIARAENVGEGYAETIPARFDRIRLNSSVDSIVDFVMRLGASVSYDKPPTGTVTLANSNGAFTHAAKTVTNASAQMLALNPNRKYLLIQNNDASGDIYVRLDGGVATAGTGIKLAAGASYECQGYTPTGAVTAIGSIASNPNVLTVEG